MRAAFAEIVDYAGLFPPASCTMADAARQYDVYRRSTERWMLGRFVVAAIRLQELGEAIDAGGIVIDVRDPWRLSVAMGAVVPAELARIAAFQAAWEPRGVLADSIEYRVASVGQVLALGEQIPHLFRRYFEVPQVGPYRDIVGAIGQVGAFAKVRTGGMSPERFPAATELTRFLLAVVKHGVPFKATAGLHHPFRGHYPISYAHDAERQVMYGFVNLLLATAELQRGGEGEVAQAILEEGDRSAILRDGDGITWRDQRYSYAELTAAHQRLFIGFGSCSFREPVDELGVAA
ncbi:MAG: hypothetical protein ACRELE_10560 [Gemmatimonadales bacterium]